MKKILAFIFIGLILCSASCKGEPKIVKTYEVADPGLTEQYFDDGRTVTMTEYYEMDDGTYKTKDGHTYKYRLVITGRMHSAVRDSTFVYLSNTKDITFDMAWKAAGFSSNLADYFSPDTAVLVEIG